MIGRVVGQPTDEDFKAYLADFDAVLNRGLPYASIMITKPHTPMTKARHARMQASWLATNEQRIRDLCAGAAFVLPSPVMRGVLRAILKMQGLPVPYKVFREEEEGIRWALERLAKAGAA